MVGVGQPKVLESIEVLAFTAINEAAEVTVRVTAEVTGLENLPGLTAIWVERVVASLRSTALVTVRHLETVEALEVLATPLSSFFH